MADRVPAEGLGEARGLVGMRYFVVVALGVVGGILGGLFRMPLSVLAPEWVFLTLPLFLGALFAASLAHLARGSAGGRFSRVVLAASSVAAPCTLINLLLFLQTLMGVLHPIWVIGPPGFVMGFAEVLAVGTVAGVATTRGSPAGRWSNLRVWVFVLGGATVMLCGAFALPGMLACSSEERQVFGEFDQYAGLRVEPTGNPAANSCAAYYATRDGKEQVFAYFEEQFEKNGWEERPSESYSIRMRDGEEFCAPSDLIAERGGFRYTVNVEEIDPEAGGHAPGTGIAAHVSRVREDERGLPPPAGPPPGCRLQGSGSPGR